MWVELGGERKRITRDVLLEVIDRRDLRARTADDPAVSLWIHGWENALLIASQRLNWIGLR